MSIIILIIILYDNNYKIKSNLTSFLIASHVQHWIQSRPWNQMNFVV